jgi:molybdate transport system permease protein
MTAPATEQRPGSAREAAPVATRGSLGRIPVVLLLPAVLAAALLVVPTVSLVLKTPWGDFLGQVTSTPVLQALWLTCVASVATVVLCLVLGTPLAWLLARVEFRGSSWLRAAVLVPLVLPPVVAGVALITALGRTGLVGRWLYEWFGLTLPYTTLAVVIAHTFVSIPFYVLSVEGALRASGQELDLVAATLGADRWTTFRRVSLPLALPGVVAGAALAWARSLGEFGATITFAGNTPGVTQTVPLLVYESLEAGDLDAAVAMSLVLVVVSLGVLVLLRDRWLRPGAPPTTGTAA